MRVIIKIGGPVEKKLCKHSTIKIIRDEEHKRIVPVKGVIRAYFSWSKKYHADVPRVACVFCKKSIVAFGFIVQVHSEEVPF